MATAADEHELNEQVKTLANYVIDNLPTRDQVNRRFDQVDDRFTRVDAGIAEVNSKVANLAVSMVEFKTDIMRRMERLESQMTEILKRLPPSP